MKKLTNSLLLSGESWSRAWVGGCEHPSRGSKTLSSSARTLPPRTPWTRTKWERELSLWTILWAILFCDFLILQTYFFVWCSFMLVGVHVFNQGIISLLAGAVPIPITSGWYHLTGEYMWSVSAGGGSGESGLPGSSAGSAALPHRAAHPAAA